MAVGGNSAALTNVKTLNSQYDMHQLCHDTKSREQIQVWIVSVLTTPYRRAQGNKLSIDLPHHIHDSYSEASYYNPHVIEPAFGNPMVTSQSLCDSDNVKAGKQNDISWLFRLKVPLT